MEPHTSTAALTVALALAAGVVAQSLARHLRMPGIVLLLGAGVLLGPDVLGWVHPASMGPALQMLVGFAVAVILFEGGLNLKWSRLRRQATVIQRLITVGALVTVAGGALAAWRFMGWDWRLAVSFGALVVVTGPTVIGPLLRRIKVTRRVETVLEAEGVLIDAVGAVLAIVTLEVVISATAASLAEGALDFVTRIGFGLIAGLVAGVVITFLLARRHVVPDGLENIFTLSLVLAAFQLSNAVIAESGILTATVAGMIVGNRATRVRRELMEFKEQLTMLFIGLLFVLLAADVRIAQVAELGMPGVLTVAALMLVVRPVNVAVSTAGSDLSWRERTFLSWVAPRGVVAAAVASLFAHSLAAEGIAGAESLRALVFTVIAVTVVVQGLTGGLLARALGLRRPSGRGWVILGANEVGRALGRLLVARGEEVALIDNDAEATRLAEEDELRVFFGNVTEERTLQRARLDERKGCVAATANVEVNLLFAREAADEYKAPEVHVGLRPTKSSTLPKVVVETEAHVLFGKPRDIELWNVRLRRGIAEIETWVLGDGEPQPDAGTDGDEGAPDPFDFPENVALPLVLERGSKAYPVSSGRPFKPGDRVWFAVMKEDPAEARRQMRARGWHLE